MELEGRGSSCAFRPRGGGAPAAAAAVTEPGGGPVPARGCMGWQHDQQTPSLPVCLP